MGVKAILRYLLGGCIKEDIKYGFFNGEFKDERIALDVAGLLYTCALRERSSYISGDYKPALKHFHRHIIYLHSICSWNMCVLFDGRDSELKAPERQRRYESTSPSTTSSSATKRIRNDPLYIAMAVKICKVRRIQCMMAHKEADSQCRHIDWNGFQPTLVVTGDMVV